MDLVLKLDKIYPRREAREDPAPNTCPLESISFKTRINMLPSLCPTAESISVSSFLSPDSLLLPVHLPLPLVAMSNIQDADLSGLTVVDPGALLSK